MGWHHKAKLSVILTVPLTIGAALIAVAVEAHHSKAHFRRLQALVQLERFRDGQRFV